MACQANLWNRCVAELEENLTSSNMLKVYSYEWKYSLSKPPALYNNILTVFLIHRIVEKFKNEFAVDDKKTMDCKESK